jgi:hypothetical protein
MTFSAGNQSDLGSTHQANVLIQLAHRLEVAKAHHNLSLVAALENEYQQLTSLGQRATVISFGSRLQLLWLRFAKTLSDWNKVHIEQTVDANGQRSWYAYNPQSSEALVTGSKADLQQWIKKSYWEQ